MCVRPVILTIAACLVGAQGTDSADKFRDTLHDKVNALRAKEGLLPLTRNDKLDAAAQKHAENMARQDKMAHELDGKRSVDRVQKEEYAASVVAENIAQVTLRGTNTPAAVVDAWHNSPGHYRNIKLDAVTETGLGAAKSKSGKWYYCQVFAAPKKQ
jgi:uncharacterized protein YkwD